GGGPEVLERVVVEPKLSTAFPDLADLAVAATGAHELEHGGAVSGGRRKVPAVVHRRVVHGGPALADVLERHHKPRDLAIIRGAGGAEAGARLELRSCLAGFEPAGDVDRTELLWKALDPAPVHR